MVGNGRKCFSVRSTRAIQGSVAAIVALSALMGAIGDGAGSIDVHGGLGLLVSAGLVLLVFRSVTSGVCVLGEEIMVRSLLRSRRIRISELRAINCVQYEGVLSGGVPSAYLGMVSVTRKNGVQIEFPGIWGMYNQVANLCHDVSKCLDDRGSSQMTV